MNHSAKDEQLIKQILTSAKTIAMVGVSSIKKEESSNIKRRPSIIVMKYLQEFGYRVIPVNPFSVGRKIYGEFVVAQLENIKIPIDIVDVFRPSKEAPMIAEESVKLEQKFFGYNMVFKVMKQKKLWNPKKFFTFLINV